MHLSAQFKLYHYHILILFFNLLKRKRRIGITNLMSSFPALFELSINCISTVATCNLQGIVAIPLNRFVVLEILTCLQIYTSGLAFVCEIAILLMGDSMVPIFVILYKLMRDSKCLNLNSTNGQRGIF